MAAKKITKIDLKKTKQQLELMILEDVSNIGKPAYAYNVVHGIWHDYPMSYNCFDTAQQFNSEVRTLNDKRIHLFAVKHSEFTAGGVKYTIKLLIFQFKKEDGSFVQPNQFIGVDPLGVLFGSLVPGYHYIIFE